MKCFIYFLKFTSEKLLSSGPPHVLYSIGLSQFLLTGWGHNVYIGCMLVTQISNHILREQINYPIFEDFLLYFLK